MKTTSRRIVCLLAIAILAGCASLSPMYELNNQPVGGGKTLPEVQAAIKSGATAAGWSTQDAGAGKIIATYLIRTHVVVVDINYSAASYSIEYDKSEQMKIFCTEDDKKNNQVRITGEYTCKDGAKPKYIHSAYQEWLDDLNAAIKTALKSG